MISKFFLCILSFLRNSSKIIHLFSFVYFSFLGLRRWYILIKSFFFGYFFLCVSVVLFGNPEQTQHFWCRIFHLTSISIDISLLIFLAILCFRAISNRWTFFSLFISFFGVWYIVRSVIYYDLDVCLYFFSLWFFLFSFSKNRKSDNFLGKIFEPFFFCLFFFFGFGYMWNYW